MKRAAKPQTVGEAYGEAIVDGFIVARRITVTVGSRVTDPDWGVGTVTKIGGPNAWVTFNGGAQVRRPISRLDHYEYDDRPPPDPDDEDYEERGGNPHHPRQPTRRP